MFHPRCSDFFSKLRIAARLATCAAALGLAAIVWPAGTIWAQVGPDPFRLFDQVTVNWPFSVSMAMRGITTPNGLLIRLEGYVGYNDSTGNFFVRHQTGDIPTSLYNPPPR